MPSFLDIRHLDTHDSRQAFPLIQSLLPSLTLDEWLEFIDALSLLPQPRASGVIAAYNGRGYIHGLFSYAVRADLAHGRILEVDNFVAFEFPDARGVTRELADGMDRLAVDYGCRAIHVDLPERSLAPAAADPLVAVFKERGHSRHRLGLCKQL